MAACDRCDGVGVVRERREGQDYHHRCGRCESVQSGLYPSELRDIADRRGGAPMIAFC